MRNDLEKRALRAMQQEQQAREQQAREAHQAGLENERRENERIHAEKADDAIAETERILGIRTRPSDWQPYRSRQEYENYPATVTEGVETVINGVKVYYHLGACSLDKDRYSGGAGYGSGTLTLPSSGRRWRCSGSKRSAADGNATIKQAVGCLRLERPGRFRTQFERRRCRTLHGAICPDPRL